MTDKIEKYPILKTAMSRIGHQYADSEKFKKFIEITLEPIVELQSVLLRMLDIDVDNAKGYKLDLIGRIVGAPAVIPAAIPQPFFGYDNQEMSEGFGELDDPNAGGHWREMGQVSNTDWILQADDYRTSVNAQIAKNSSNCTPDEIIRVAQIVLGEAVIFKYIERTMIIVIAPKEPVLRAQREFLKSVLPIPAGVSFIIINGQYNNFSLTNDEIWNEISYEDY